MNGAPESFPPLVVGSDPKGTDQATRPAFTFALIAAGLIPLFGVVITALVTSSGGVALGVTSGVVFGVVGWLMLLLVVQLASVRGAQSVRRTVLTLDAAGLHGSIPQGEVFLPWGAIERVSVRTRATSRIAAFHLVPGVTEHSPGITTTLPARSFATIARLGFQVGEVAIDTPLDTVLAAAGAFTGGRLR